MRKGQKRGGEGQKRGREGWEKEGWRDVRGGVDGGHGEQREIKAYGYKEEERDMHGVLRGRGMRGSKKRGYYDRKGRSMREKGWSTIMMLVLSLQLSCISFSSCVSAPPASAASSASPASPAFAASLALSHCTTGRVPLSACPTQSLTIA